MTQRGGRRWSAADAYLRPALKRPNLEVLTGAQVLGVEMREGRAVGVRHATRGGSTVATAGTEVILAAGSLGSPQLLLLSGIGPAADLADLGIGVAPHQPRVGANHQDHPKQV